VTDTPTERAAETTWTRLRRRKVVQWGIAYVAGAWALLQGLEYLSTTFEWSRYIQQLATVGLILGMPIVLVIAWYHGDRGELRIRGTELVIVTLLFLVGGGLLWRFDRATEPTVETSATAAQSVAAAAPTPAPDDNSIAVLPFADMSQAKDQEYMSDGIAEELLSLLAKVPDLKVIARTSSFAFKGQNVEIADIAKRLNVAHVLEGSVRKSGNTLRITAQLIRAADSTHVWSETYDRTLEDIFAVQDDIAQRVADALKLALLGRKNAVTSERPEVEAYGLRLQGRYFAQRANYDRAIDYLRRSLEREPSSAQAWSELALVQIAQGDDGLIPPREGYAQARDSVQRAIALAPNFAAAHATLAWIQAYEFDWKSAEESAERALALERGSATVLLQAGWIMADLGRMDESVKLIERSIELDPMHWRGYQFHALLMIALGRFEEAEASYRKLSEMMPDAYTSSLGWALMLQGRADEAKQAIDAEPNETWRLLFLSYWYFNQGRRSESDASLERLVTEHPDQMEAYYIAELHAFRGEDDLAFEWLDRAYEKRESAIGDIRLSRDFRRLRGDPRYAAFLRKIKLPNESGT